MSQLGPPREIKVTEYRMQGNFDVKKTADFTNKMLTKMKKLYRKPVLLGALINI